MCDDTNNTSLAGTTFIARLYVTLAGTTAPVGFGLFLPSSYTALHLYIYTSKLHMIME